MNMSDAATGQILWQDDDWGDLLTEREIHIPARILRCAAVSREFQFSSVEMLQGLRLEQRIFFRGNLMEGVRREAGRIMRPPPSTAAEYSRCRDQPVRLAVPSAEWYFQFGFVIPNSTNTWQQTIEAADESRMLPATALDGTCSSRPPSSTTTFSCARLCCGSSTTRDACALPPSLAKSTVDCSASCSALSSSSGA
jgi:retinal rod rhodopsin-sensitive cGMP 3',5'-cyclic phosphodiesterase subunit delta